MPTMLRRRQVPSVLTGENGRRMSIEHKNWNSLGAGWGLHGLVDFDAGVTIRVTTAAPPCPCRRPRVRHGMLR